MPDFLRRIRTLLITTALPRRLASLLAAAALLVSACGPAAPPAAPTPAAVETAAPTAAPSPQPTTEPLPTAIPAAQRPAYDLTVTLDYARHTAAVQQTLTLPNPTGAPLDELILLAPASRYPGGLTMESLALGDGAPLPLPAAEDGQVVIALPAPLPPGQAVTLNASYQIRLPPIPPADEAIKPEPFGYTEVQANLVDWYLFQPPYQDGAWLINDPTYYGEYLAYPAADFTVSLELAPAQAEIIVAASAQPDADGRYRLPAARGFAISASPYYQVTEQTLGDVTVFHYALPWAVYPAEQVLQDTTAALAVFSERFGPYPYRSLSVVQADFLDGMEYSGLYFLSGGFYNLYDGTPKGYLTLIAAHETAHQWWYSQVGNDQAGEPWLDEALCTYSERIFYEEVYPDLLDWWWEYRVNFYTPSGPVDLPVSAYHGYLPYRNAVYLRGALFLEEARQAMGDAAFDRFIREYMTSYREDLATGDEFFALLGQYLDDAQGAALRETYFAPANNNP